MNKDRFWALIEESQKTIEPDQSSSNQDIQVKRLKGILRGLAPDEIIAFDRTFMELSIGAYRWELWGAAYSIEGGCSDDGFADFLSWLISMGRDVYENALVDPESLATISTEPGDRLTRFEEFAYIASNVYDEKAGDEVMPDHGIRYPKEPAGKEWKEDKEELKRLYPKLWAKFGSGRGS